MSANTPYKKRIAPRLASGDPRIAWGGRLPDHVKEGLRRIAYAERKSMSWVLEEVVIEFFRLDRPEYVNDPESAKTGRVLSTARAHKRRAS